MSLRIFFSRILKVEIIFYIPKTSYKKKNFEAQYTSRRKKSNIVFFIDYGATLTIQTWVGWSDFFTYAIKGLEYNLNLFNSSLLPFYCKAIQKLY